MVAERVSFLPLRAATFLSKPRNQVPGRLEVVGPVADVLPLLVQWWHRSHDVELALLEVVAFLPVLGGGPFSTTDLHRDGSGPDYLRSAK